MDISVKRVWQGKEWPERELCRLSAAGAECQRGMEILDRPLGPARRLPLTAGQWQALRAQAVVLVPLIDPEWNLVTDRNQLQIELSFTRRGGETDSYHVVLNPDTVRGQVALLVQGLLAITRL
jgi:hypothetical protein